MITLALDCSQNKLVLALINEQNIVSSHVHPVEDTSQGLLQSLEILLKENKVELDDIQNIVFGHGPGSFTSLRVGLATLYGLFAFQHSPRRQWAGVSSLELRMLSQKTTTPFEAVVFPARLQKYYVGWYDDQGQFREHCLSESELQKLENEAGLKVVCGRFGQMDLDPLEPQAFLKIIKKNISFQEFTESSAILNYLQPEDDVAQVSKSKSF